MQRTDANQFRIGKTGENAGNRKRDADMVQPENGNRSIFRSFPVVLRKVSDGYGIKER
jgi:hypothetical protein